MTVTQTSERYEAFVALFARHEPGLRGFIRSLLPARESVEEVIQETSLVMWKRFDTFEQGTDFLNWACTIARFKVLHHRRRAARDRLRFDEDVVARIAEETEARRDQLEAERRAMNVCIKKLDKARRKLLARCYLEGVTMRQAAAEAGRTPAAVYKLLARTRQSLLDCIRGQLAGGGQDV